MMQTIITLVIVGVALFFALRKVVRKVGGKEKGCGCGCSGCTGCPHEARAREVQNGADSCSCEDCKRK